MQAIGGPATPGKTPLLHSTHAQGTTDQPTKPKSNQSNPASHAAAASPSTTSTLDFLMYIRCRLTSPPQTEDFNSDQLNCAAFRYANLSPRTKKLYRTHKPPSGWLVCEDFGSRTLYAYGTSQTFFHMHHLLPPADAAQEHRYWRCVCKPVESANLRTSKRFQQKQQQRNRSNFPIKSRRIRSDATDEWMGGDARETDDGDTGLVVVRSICHLKTRILKGILNICSLQQETAWLRPPLCVCVATMWCFVRPAGEPSCVTRVRI